MLYRLAQFGRAGFVYGGRLEFRHKFEKRVESAFVIEFLLLQLQQTGFMLTNSTPSKNDILPKRFDWASFRSYWMRRPLSVLTVLLALVVITVPLYQLSKGISYFEPLDYIDGTTLIMLGILFLHCVAVYRNDTDLQAVSLAVVAGLSFIYTFEALYKWSFFINPLNMPSDEMRALVIQIGTALTGLVGFAFGKFKWTKPSKIFTALFILGWLFWLGIGYPQIFSAGKLFLHPVLPFSLSESMVYLLNRVVKFVLFLVFFFAVQPDKKKQSVPAPTVRTASREKVTEGGTLPHGKMLPR